MNKKLYYAIITPLFIIGFIFPAIQSYLLVVLILVAGYFTWMDLKNAEGEEEISRIIIPLSILMIFVVLFIISLFLN